MLERKYKIEEGKLVKKSNSVPIPEDEPLFILRAQDRNALPAIMAYCHLSDNLLHREEVMKSVLDFKKFATNNPERMKEPD
jgi:hypothetical protein